MDKIGEAQAALRSGKFVLVFDSDSREAETDMMIASEHVTFESVRTLRKEAGGLICTTAPAEVSRKLDLPFLAELFAESYGKHPVLKGLAPNDLPYDTKSAFSLTINHRHTFTGIPDRDRALTISEFAKLGKAYPGAEPGAGPQRAGRGFPGPRARVPAELPAGSAQRPPGTYRTGHRAADDGRDVPLGHHLRDDGGRRQGPAQGEGSRVRQPIWPALPGGARRSSRRGRRACIQDDQSDGQRRVRHPAHRDMCTT